MKTKILAVVVLLIFAAAAWIVLQIVPHNLRDWGWYPAIAAYAFVAQRVAAWVWGVEDRRFAQHYGRVLRALDEAPRGLSDEEIDKIIKGTK